MRERDVFLKNCPVCRVGVVRVKKARSRLFGLLTSYHYVCDSCDSIIVPFQDRYQYRTIDARYPVQARMLGDKVFTRSELRDIASKKA